MEIVNYSDRYFLDVVKIIENFHKEAVGEYDDLFSPETVIKTIKSADPNDAFLLIINNTCQGILYGQTITSKINDRKVYQEMIWYVNKDFRGFGAKLYLEAQKILKNNGVSIMIMVALANSKSKELDSFYKRLGFKAMETHYVRNL